MEDTKRDHSTSCAEQDADGVVEPPVRREVLAQIATLATAAAAAGLATGLLSGEASAQDVPPAVQVTRAPNGGLSFRVKSKEIGEALKQAGMLPAGVAPGKVSIHISFGAKP
jgi:hypothetical protein